MINLTERLLIPETVENTQYVMQEEQVITLAKKD